MSFIFAKQSLRYRSVLQGRSRFLGLFLGGKALSYVGKDNIIPYFFDLIEEIWYNIVLVRWGYLIPRQYFYFSTKTYSLEPVRPRLTT